MTHRIPREGSLLRISLGDGTCSYVRVLPKSQVAVYAHRDSGTGDAYSLAYDSKILWTLTVMKSALKSGRWTVVDYRPLEPELLAPVCYFIKDRISGRFSVYRSSDGSTRESDFEECNGLEAAAVWEAEHVEDRLRDHFSGRPNVWAEQLKATP